MWVVSHGLQRRRYGFGSARVSAVETSPFAMGSVTISAICRATSAMPSSIVIPAAFRGRDASSVRLRASASLQGATAVATWAMSARR